MKPHLKYHCGFWTCRIGKTIHGWGYGLTPAVAYYDYWFRVRGKAHGIGAAD
jgi:hypothetical protein